jgi:PAS domain S-box-containing protein
LAELPNRSRIATETAAPPAIIQEMPRSTRTRTRRPAEAGRLAGSMTADRPLIALLAQTTKPSDMLPALHQHALDVTGGVCTLLFQHNPRNGLLHSTSGFRIDALRTDAWSPGTEEAAVVEGAFDQAQPMLVPDADRQTPDLAARLGTGSALLLPLSRGAERVGLLAIGFAQAPDASTLAMDAMAVADAFVTSLELFHLRQREQLQRDLVALLDTFSTTVSATLTVSAGLDTLCQGANRLFAADRTSVWIHDRRARHLVLRASSDMAHMERGARIDAEDALAPAALAMRGLRADLQPSGEAATATLTVPLRGRRRALGAIVFEGARIDPGGELDVLDRADELGRQLSSAIDNIQLLDDVVRSRRELENILDSISHLVAVVDGRGCIVHVNNAFASRVGRSREELLDRPIHESVGPELAAWLDQRRNDPGHNADSAATVETFDPVLRGPFMVTATDLRDHDSAHAGTVIVARDLVSQTQLEGEREELRRRLTQTEKLAALGQFVAGIAHELNNPLQGVLGHMELLRATGAFPKQLRREVQTIYREADRAAKIVHNLLVFAGSRRVARRSVSLNAVLQKVLALRASAHRALDIEVVRHYDERLPRVASDPLLLHQVFLNMVMNAEHAIASTGRRGRIELTTAVARSGDRIVVTVRDTGTGIPEDTLTRIFEPFYTTKEVGKGTGLGLAIAYGIVQEHGGHISAANHPDGGAVFTVELPTTRPAGR